MTKLFKVSQIRDLLNQVYNDKISFSRFVEILNEQVDQTKKISIEKLGETHHVAIDTYNKVNEIIDVLNNLKL